MLNTATPAVRFAGISVQDSGSNAGVTGSIYWDGLCNRWIYSNPSDIGYSGGMLLSGPRTSTLGSEAPLTCNYIAKSGGGDHLYDSCIQEVSGSVTIGGTLCSSGVVCGASIISNGIVTGNDFYNGISYPYNTNFGSGADASITTIRAGSTNGYQSCITLQGAGCIIINTSSSQRVNITSTGISCFSCQICAPSFIGGTLSGTSATITNTGTACTITDVLTLTNAQSGFSSICAGASILFTGNGGATLARIYSRGNMNSNNGSDLVFQTQISAGGGPQCTMVINGGSQNVGIGTFGPEYPLHIYRCNPLGLKIQTCGSTFGSPSINLLNGGVDTVLTATNTGLEIGTWSANSLLFRTTQQSRLTIDSNGISTFSCNICAPAINTQTYLGVTKAGADGVGEGPYLVIAQPSQSKQWIQQLNASAGLDYWHYNGSAWSMPLKLTSAGSTCFACPIFVPRVYERPDDLTVTCNMTGFRSLNLAHQGAAGYIDINPVRLFSLPYQGGLFFIQITTWQRRYEYGIINWVDNGSNVPIIAVNYTTISCNPGASTPIQISATVPNPGSDNIIRIYICNMHSNGHGYSGMIYAVS
jgi:hypothetical protein